MLGGVDREILVEYARRRSDDSVTAFVRDQLAYFQNPKPERITNTQRKFNTSWGPSVEDFWADERKAAIESIMNIRHHAAHGAHFGTTINQMRGYHEKAVEVIKYLERMILGDGSLT